MIATSREQRVSTPPLTSNTLAYTHTTYPPTDPQTQRHTSDHTVSAWPRGDKDAQIWCTDQGKGDNLKQTNHFFFTTNNTSTQLLIIVFTFQCVSGFSAKTSKQKQSMKIPFSVSQQTTQQLTAAEVPTVGTTVLSLVWLSTIEKYWDQISYVCIREEYVQLYVRVSQRVCILTSSWISAYYYKLLLDNKIFLTWHAVSTVLEPRMCERMRWRSKPVRLKHIAFTFYWVVMMN